MNIVEDEIENVRVRESKNNVTTQNISRRRKKMKCKDCGRQTNNQSRLCDRCSIGEEYLKPTAKEWMKEYINHKDFKKQIKKLVDNALIESVDRQNEVPTLQQVVVRVNEMVSDLTDTPIGDMPEEAFPKIRTVVTYYYNILYKRIKKEVTYSYTSQELFKK